MFDVGALDYFSYSNKLQLCNIILHDFGALKF